MAIAWGRGALNGNGTGSNTTVTVTINNGETAVATVFMNTPGSSVSGISGGGTWVRRSTVTNGNLVTEQWSTNAGAAIAAASVVVSFAGTTGTTEVGAIVDAYTGVVALGTTNTGSGATANPSIAITTQDANNFVVGGFGFLTNALAPTAGTGNLREAGKIINESGGSVDNTAASPSSVTDSVTHAADTWCAVALELRSTSGADTVPLLGSLFVGPRYR